MQEMRFTNVSEAVQYFNQTHRQNQAKKIARRRQIVALKRHIKQAQNKMMANQIQKVLNNLFLTMKDFLLRNNVQMLNEKRLILSNIILKKICQFIGYSLPERASKAYFDTFIVNIADNLAIWLNTFEVNSGYNIFDEVAICEPEIVERKPELVPESQDDNYYPIDDYIEYSTDDISSASCPSSRNSDYEEDEDEEEEGGEGEYEEDYMASEEEQEWNEEE